MDGMGIGVGAAGASDPPRLRRARGCTDRLRIDLADRQGHCLVDWYALYYYVFRLSSAGQ